MSKFKRAYSDADKQQREEMIIDAAQDLLMEKSFHSINMSEIARHSNLAKGTVYLYFQTKEELFLTLFVRQFGEWMDIVETQIKALDETADKQDVIRILVTTTTQNRQLIRLAALTNIIFEHNISYEKTLEYKIWLNEKVGYLGKIIEQLLKLQPTQGYLLLYRLYVFVIGLENLANPTPIAQQVYENEPMLPHPDFETELTTLMTLVIDAL